MADDNIQQLIDSLGSGETLELPSNREIKGPAVIRTPIIINGRGATLWCPRGPVLSIETDGIVLRNLNIEITGKEEKLHSDEAYALIISPNRNVQCNDVTIRGKVKGLREEEGDWHYPRSIRLETLKPEQHHEFTMKLSIPVPCCLLSEVAGLSLSPNNVRGEGLTEIKVKLDPLPPRVLIRGSIQLRSAFLARRIIVSGNMAPDMESPSARVGVGDLIYEPPEVTSDIPLEPASKPTREFEPNSGISRYRSPLVVESRKPAEIGGGFTKITRTDEATTTTSSLSSSILSPREERKRISSTSLSTMWNSSKKNDQSDIQESDFQVKKRCLNFESSTFSKKNTIEEKQIMSGPIGSDPKEMDNLKQPAMRKIIRSQGVGSGFDHKKEDEE